MVKGTKHQEATQKVIDFLVSRQVEQKLLDMKFARWSVRAGGSDSVKSMTVDYKAAAAFASRAEREGLALLEGRKLP
jgi:ABC-type Fe3+ transport system substrate-binding protein